MRKYLVVFLVLSLVFNLWLVMQDRNNPEVPPEAEEAVEWKNYPYLSKRIFTEKQNDLLIHFVPLRKTLKDYVHRYSGNLGVYFEYLPTGVSIGANEQLQVRMASLIKVPVVMAVYRQMDQGKIRADQSLTVRGEDISSSSGQLWKQGDGYQLSVDEAINLALSESDNTAANVLEQILPDGAVGEVFQYLDIPLDTETGYPAITPKNYSSILRNLYLSTFLNKANSNEILRRLVHTKFEQLIPSGIPEDIPVAHKFGVYDSQQILSDCGIVYPEDRPYILCVMARMERAEAEEAIREVSRMVYSYVSYEQNK